MTKLIINFGVFSLFLFSTAMAQPLAPTENFDLPNYDVGDDGLGGDNAMPASDDMDMGAVLAPIAGNAADDYSYKVYNVSQQNADAEVSGAKEGDVLRYEFVIDSPVNDVVNFVASIDISNVIPNVEIVDSGLGDVTGGTIAFPSFTQQAPCKKVFTFFTRVKDCEGQKTIVSTGHGETTSVNLTCELAKSGPSTTLMLYMMLGVAGFVLIGVLSRRKKQ